MDVEELDPALKEENVEKEKYYNTKTQLQPLICLYFLFFFTCCFFPAKYTSYTIMCLSFALKKYIQLQNISYDLNFLK